MGEFYRKTGRTLVVLCLMSGFMSSSFFAHAADKAEIDEQYRAAMFLREQGKLLEAIKAFNSILANQPTLHRARMELAVAHYRARNFKEAKENAQRVLDDPKTPVNVKIAVNSFLVQIKIEEEKFYAQRKQWKPSLSVGLMYDENVNAGPSSDTVQLGNSVLPVSANSLPREDWAVTAFGSLEHSWLADKPVSIGNSSAHFYWNSLAQVYHREYHDEDDFNLSVVSLATGPAWSSMHNWRANIKAQYDYITLGSDHLANYASVTPSITWQFKDAEVTANVLVQDRNFQRTQDVGRDGVFVQTGVSYGRIMNNKKLGIQVGIRALDYEADNNRFGYNGRELFAGGNYVAWKNGAIYGRISRKVSRYEDIEPSFGVARDEDEDRILIGFKHKFKANKLDGWSLNGTVTLIEVDSNIDTYTYDRDQVALTLSRSF